MSLTMHKETGADTPALTPSLLEIYDMFFEVVPATTPDLLEEAHRLRYQVYCVENEFEPQNPHGLEMDAYDRWAKHSLLIHRATQRVAGTVRVILPRSAGAADLPAVQTSSALEALGPGRLPKATTAEISRFAISKDFRQRIDDGQLPAVHEEDEARAPEDINRRVLPSLTLGLMRAIVQMSVENDMTHWCAVADIPLLRLLKRLGIRFEAVGPRVQHHGWRQPVHSEIAGLMDGIFQARPEVWDVITHQGRLWPQPASRSSQRIAG